MESAAQNSKGFQIDYKAGIRKDAYLFGEAQSRIVVSVSPDKVTDFEAKMGSHPFEKLGTVTPGNVLVGGEDWGVITTWKEMYDTAIEKELAK